MSGLLDWRSVCPAHGSGTFYGVIRLATHKKRWRNSSESQRDVAFGSTTEALRRHKSPLLGLCREHFIGYTKGICPQSANLQMQCQRDCILISAHPYPCPWVAPEEVLSLHCSWLVGGFSVEISWKCSSTRAVFPVTSLYMLNRLRFIEGESS